MSVGPYKRVVLKLSGEALAGEAGFGLSPQIIKSVAEEVKEVVDLGVEVAVVVGGGNIWRGKVTGFTRYAVGEGIEKREDNFAEEVMNQVKGN